MACTVPQQCQQPHVACIGGNHVQGYELPREKAHSVPPKSAVWGFTGQVVGKAHAKRPGWEGLGTAPRGQVPLFTGASVS